MAQYASKILTQAEINKNQLDYAEKFSEGDCDLKNLLLWCWQNNITTNGCCCGHGEAGYISFNINENDFKLFIYFYECFKTKVGYDLYVSNMGHFEIFLKGTKEQTNFKEILSLLKKFKPKSNAKLEKILNMFVSNSKYCNYLKIYPYKNSLYVSWTKNFNLNENSIDDVCKSLELINKI